MEQPSYLPRLYAIREVLERHVPDFPKGGCTFAEALVADQLQLHRIGGSFRGNEGLKGHFWNYDLERKLIIDLSADQFEEAKPLIDRGVLIVPHDHERYMRTHRLGTALPEYMVGHITNLRQHLTQDK